MTYGASFRARLLIALLGAALVLSGCSGPTTGSAEGSRAVSYDSISALMADSTLIVVGQVTETRSVRDVDDVMPFTINTFHVDATVESSELAGNGLKAQSVSVGTELDVRQLGDSPETAAVPLLKLGTTYLLFLTPSQLPGKLASQFYITGADAGLYSTAKGGSVSGASFAPVAANEVDKLPNTLLIADIPSGSLKQ